ncbi:MAG: ATP-binding protein [Chlorobiaceae bacterium]
MQKSRCRKKTQPPPVKSRHSKQLDQPSINQASDLLSPGAPTENQFRVITEHIDGVAFTVDSNSILNYVSPAAENMFGFLPNEMSGMSFAGFLEEEKEIPEAFAAIHKTSLHNLPPQILELHFRRKNGSLFWGELHLTYSLDDEKPGIIGLLHDVTLRKSLQLHTLFRSSLFEKAEVCSIEELLQATLDEAEHLTGSTIGFCYFLGDDMREPVIEVLSTNSDSFCPLNQKGYFIEVLKAQGTVIHNEIDTIEIYSDFRRTLVVPIMNGEMVTAIIGVGGKSSFYGEDDEKELKGFADLASDLVLRKRADQIKKDDQLSLIQAQKMAFLGSIINKIGADYLHMLTFMLEIFDTILEQAKISPLLGKKIMDSVEFVGGSKDMITNLITFAGSSAVMPLVLELNILVEEKLSELRELIGGRIPLIWIPDRQRTLVKVDPSQIDNLLACLCLNARDAITGKGRITIETSRIFIDQDDCEAGHPCNKPGHYAVLSVTDNGVGIDKKDLPYIFEPLFSTKEEGKRMGLGLSIAYGICKQNHGSIDCRTELGKGTTFTIYLPRYMGNHYFSEDEDPPENQDLNRTILLVEEEPDILKRYQRMLEKTGHTVFAVSIPDEAISVATEHRSAIDLLLTNVVLRKINGCNLSQKLLLICPKLKTLFISDDHNDTTARYGELEDGVAFIRKPFCIEQLNMKINELMNPVLVDH